MIFKAESRKLKLTLLLRLRFFILDHVCHFNYYLVKRLQTKYLIANAAFLQQLLEFHSQVRFFDVSVIKTGKFGY